MKTTIFSQVFRIEEIKNQDEGICWSIGQVNIFNMLIIAARLNLVEFWGIGLAFKKPKQIVNEISILFFSKFKAKFPRVGFTVGFGRNSTYHP